MESPRRYYDAKAGKQTLWYTVDVRLKARRTMLALATLREHAARTHGLWLLRPGNRLSITPVDAAHFRFICSCCDDRVTVIADRTHRCSLDAMHPTIEHRLLARNFANTLACIFATRVYTRTPD
jgi:hypothetical protein